MFWEGKCEKDFFFFHCVGTTSVWTCHSRPSLSSALSNPSRSVSPLHMRERHEHTGDSGDRGRCLIGADLRRDLMTGINLDFRGQVGLTDAQQAAALRENHLIERCITEWYPATSEPFKWTLCLKRTWRIAGRGQSFTKQCCFLTVAHWIFFSILNPRDGCDLRKDAEQPSAPHLNPLSSSFWSSATFTASKRTGLLPCDLLITRLLDKRFEKCTQNKDR